MDWLAIGQKVLALGLPILGTALGGPLGGSIGGMIASALGVPADPTAVGTAMETTPNDVLIQKLKSVEGQYQAQVQAQADLGKVGFQEVGKVLTAELVGVGDHLGWFALFQRGWRPAFAWELLFECFLMMLVMLKEIVTGDFTTLNAVLPFSGFLEVYYGFRFGLIGVFGIGRSQEKVAAIQTAGDPTLDGGMIGKIVDLVKKKIDAE